MFDTSKYHQSHPTIPITEVMQGNKNFSKKKKIKQIKPRKETWFSIKRLWRYLYELSTFEAWEAGGITICIS
jgi:hypothetical protein